MLMDNTEDIESVLTTLKSIQIYDFLQVALNPDLLECFRKQEKNEDNSSNNETEQERLMFSSNVRKINRQGNEQDRVLIVSNKSLYNFRPNSFKNARRIIPLQDLHQIVMSTTSNEIVLQVKKDYDYRIVLDPTYREGLFLVLDSYHEKLTNGAKLPVSLTEMSNLRNYTLTKNEIKQVQKTVKETKKNGEVEDNTINAIAGLRNKSEIKVHEKKVSTGFRLRTTYYEGWITRSRGKPEDKNNKWDLFYAVLGQALRLYKARIKGTWSLKGARIEVDTPSDRDQSLTNVGVLESGDSELQQNLEVYERALIEGQIRNRRTPTPSDDRDNNKMFTHIRKPTSTDPGGKPNFSITLTTNMRLPVVLVAQDINDLDLWADALYKAIEDENSKIHLEGWVFKKHVLRKAFSRRYIVIHGSRIWQYELQKVHVINVSNRELAYPCGQTENTLSNISAFAGLISTSHYAFRWNLSVGGESLIYHFAADTQDDMRKWIDAISSARTGVVNNQLNTSNTVHNDVTVRPISQVGAPEGLITLVLTDIESSTSLWENVPDAMNESLQLHDKILRSRLQECNGYEIRTEGDAFVVAFSTVFEAVKWCLDVQLSLVKADWPQALLDQSAASTVVIKDKKIHSGVRVRMGVHSGYPTCRKNPITGRMDYHGPDVMIAKELSEAAHGGQIVLSEDVAGFIQDDDNYNSQLKDMNPIMKSLGIYKVTAAMSDTIHLYQILPEVLQYRIFPALRKIVSEKIVRRRTRSLCGVEESQLLRKLREENIIPQKQTHHIRTGSLNSLQKSISRVLINPFQPLHRAPSPNIGRSHHNLGIPTRVMTTQNRTSVFIPAINRSTGEIMPGKQINTINNDDLLNDLDQIIEESGSSSSSLKISSKEIQNPNKIQSPNSPKSPNINKKNIINNKINTKTTPPSFVRAKTISYSTSHFKQKMSPTQPYKLSPGKPSPGKPSPGKPSPGSPGKQSPSRTFITRPVHRSSISGLGTFDSIAKSSQKSSTTQTNTKSPNRNPLRRDRLSVTNSFTSITRPRANSFNIKNKFEETLRDREKEDNKKLAIEKKERLERARSECTNTPRGDK